MNRFLQVFCYALTFFSVLAVGNFFGFFLPVDEVYFADRLPGKPLPEITLFFLAQHHAVSYFFLIPWLFFVGLPLAPFHPFPYWDAERFLLRFCVFISMELLLVFALLMACFSPYIGISSGMGETEPPFTWFEAFMRGLFWLLVLLIGGTGIKRLCWPQGSASS